MKVIQLFPDDTPSCCGDCKQGERDCVAPDACQMYAPEERQKLRLEPWFWAVITIGSIVGFLWTISK